MKINLDGMAKFVLYQEALSRSSLIAQQVRVVALSLWQLGSLLWQGLDRWLGYFCMLLAWP